MKCIAALVVFASVFLVCSGNHVKRQTAFLTPTYYAASVAPVAYTSAQYVVSPPLISSAYVAAPNPIVARASRVLGQPGFVSRYVAAPFVTSPLTVAPVAASPLVSVEPSVGTLTPVASPVAAPAKIVAPAVAPAAAPAIAPVATAAVETIAEPVAAVLPATPAKYSVAV